MKTSNEISNIAKALCEAQKKINHATKDSKNPHFKNDYASLESVIDATKASLLEQGITVVQSVEGSTLETRLQHSSGEYFESIINLLMTKNDMQGLGSSITYARRYQLAAMLNISQADDDGNAASQPQNHKAQSKAVSTLVDTIIDPQNPFDGYIINAGPNSKLTGTKLKDHSPDFLLKTIESSQKWHQENNKTMHKNTKEFVEMVTGYLKHIDFLPF
jgi:hypothetical protein